MRNHSGGVKLKKETKKELIRRAAVEVIAENGFYITTISQIAAAADISVGTIYNYFEKKEEILEYIFKIELKKRISYIEEIRKKDISFWNKLKIFLEFHFSELTENLAVAKILVREKEFPRTEHSGDISNYMFKISDEIENMIQQAAQEDKLKIDHTEVIAALIFGGIQGIVEKGIKNNDPELFKNAPEEIIKLLKKGI